MKTNKRFLLAAIFGLTLVFTFSCSSGGDSEVGNRPGDDGLSSPSSGGQGIPFNENSQIYNEYCDRDCHIGEVYKGSGVIYFNGNAGSVKDGIVINLNLPQTIPNEYLKNIDRLYLFRYEVDKKENEGCKISPEDAKIFQTSGFSLFDNNEKPIGSLNVEAYHDDDGNEYFLTYVYFTKAAKVTCDNKFKKFDIGAKAGWNKVYIKDPDSPYCDDGPNGKEICKAIVSTNSFFTKELKWVLVRDDDDR